MRGRNFLDVGCGIGADLVKADALGAKVVGVDISPEACTFVREQLGFNAYLGNLEDARLPSNSMDFIMMADLIEHPLGVRRLLDESLRVLAPRGLLVLWTPNGGAAGTSLETAKEWVGFRVDLEHMQYFTPESILILAGQYNCIVEHLESMDFPGLAGIEKPPTCGLVRETKVRDTIARLPGARRIHRAILSFARDPAANLSERDGNFRLLSILRKRGDA